MRKSRKTIGIDAEYIEALKEVARKRGTSISGYMRQLIDEALKIESMGYYAPRALMERWVELVLSKVGFAYMHVDILELEDLEEIERRGEILGSTIAELGVDSMKIIELLGLSSGVGISQGSSIILLPQSSRVKTKMFHLIKGLAKGSGLVISSSGSLVIISPPRKTII
ncbi:CopG family transcriptional regulator [Desulfurococcus amylolyticus]|uniref:Ribbon-helix-helix protein CopG domain-containing protein n=1 Tax=Desulfurococcus amylolyticus (strain DSM 18924 / JCM 16383 / VKM B-2413 / 1221n) TaxID=490899 RepID=B8D672_DESA1|nr:CopG family transcriptional regulator [Desulfurococcus amylolyticus]ACL11603.1 hypothetical protein DKAM_1277 [Desulfurococcus amylolyticus 1221n]